MSSNVTLWLKTTRKIFLGVLLYSISGILYAIVEPIGSLVGGFSDAVSFVQRGSFDGGTNFFEILSYLCLAGIIAGYALFLLGLINFAKILDGDDRKSAEMLRNGAVLMILAGLLPFLRLPGILIAVVNIVGFILMLLGYSKLKSSVTFPAKARVGAAKLFLSMILLIIGAVIGLIPLIGGIIGAILSIIAFFFMLSGWATIKNAEQ
jgi:hypothetical protein